MELNSVANATAGFRVGAVAFQRIGNGGLSPGPESRG